MATNPIIAAALTRPCPTCGAQPNQPCTTATGTRSHHPHAPRRRHPDTPPPPHTGRPPTINNPKIRRRILKSLRRGTAIRIACQAAGIGETTLYRWLQDADNPDAPPIYREFRDDLLRARARGAERLIGRIEDASQWRVKSEKPVVVQAGPKSGVVYGEDGKPLVDVTWERDWKAAAWLLERQFGAEYGRRETVAVAAADGLPGPSTGGGIDAEAVARVREALREFAQRRGITLREPMVEGEVVDEPPEGPAA